MKFADGKRSDIERNITRLSNNLGITATSLTYMVVTYDRADFTQYAVVTRPPRPFHEVPADGIATAVGGVALFLPLADCTGAILYDPVNHAVMVSHLGRHSVEQQGALASVNFMRDQFGSEPRNLLVWLGPSPNSEAYPLWKRDNMSLIEANQRDLIQAGVQRSHIEASSVDTVLNRDYFSHSEFLKGRRTKDGRFAIIAQLM